MSGALSHLKMTRRLFFGLGCALIPGVFPTLRAAAQDAASSTLIVIIDGLPEESSFAETVLAEFMRRGIPVACVIDIARLDATLANTSDQFGATIRENLARDAGLLEIVVPVDEEGDNRRYFQKRAAETLRASAAAFLSETDTTLGQRPIISLMDRREEALVDLSAYRSAGFRVLIRPGAPEPMVTEFVGNGQMRLQGSTTLSLARPQDEVLAHLGDSLSSGHDLMLVLSLAGMGDSDPDQLRTGIAEFAARIEEAQASGSVIAMRPMDYLLGAGPYQSADRALVLSLGETHEQQAAIATFVAELRAAGLPFTATGVAAPDWMMDTDDFCPDSTADHSGALSCLLSSVALPIPAPEWVPGLAIVPGDGAVWNGVRTDGRMNLVFRDWARVGPADDAPFEDLVLMIHPEDISSPTDRQALLHELVSAQDAGRIRLHTVAGLTELVLAPDPILTRLWSTRQRMVTDPPRTDALSDNERALLLDDARLAWTFIDQFTDPTTGLCAGTVRGGPGGRVNLEASLWDLASQIQGIIAARSMEIIQADEARDRVQLMLRNIPSIALGDLTLPPAMFTTDPAAEVAVRGFDFCDTGRFLIALRSAAEAGLASDADVAATLDAWDLAAMVEDGKSYNINGNNWDDVTMSHCTPYIAQAFAELGLPLHSPYHQIGDPGNTDDLVRLLYSAASIGSFGTEPLLLEAIEQGAAPEVAFLAAVLFDAQLSWYETTGRLRCVSEAPLNIQPWFIYQGLRVDRLGTEAWTIESPNTAPRFQTAEFRERAEVLSAKSAYLWAAVHPHPYCDKLVDVIRDKGRVEGLGFSVGVFAQTLEPMENYSDLNTNGIILSAIAAMLEPSWPNL